MHHAYSKHAEVTVPSLDDWEKSFRTGTVAKAEMPEVKVLPVDFRAATEATQNRGAANALAVAQLN